MKCLGGPAFAFCVMAGVACAEPVELELVLAVDASASVSAKEFDLQMLGIALAFRDPTVLSVIEALGPDGMAVMLTTWSGERHQINSVPWHLVTDAASADAFALAVAGVLRQDDLGTTAIGQAINYAAFAILNNAYEGRRLVIDISSDGRSNRGEKPALARDRAVGLGIVINALVVENEEPHLIRYFSNNVIGGLGAFGQSAPNYNDYAEAIRRKLIREINGAPIAALANQAAGAPP